MLESVAFDVVELWLRSPVDRVVFSAQSEPRVPYVSREVLVIEVSQVDTLRRVRVVDIPVGDREVLGGAVHRVAIQHGSFTTSDSLVQIGLSGTSPRLLSQLLLGRQEKVHRGFILGHWAGRLLNGDLTW